MTPREYITQQVLKTKVFYSHKMQQQKERNSLFAKPPPSQNRASIDQSTQHSKIPNTEMILQQQIQDAEVDMGLGLVESALEKLEDVLTVGKNNLKKDQATTLFTSVYDLCNKHGSRLLKEDSQLIKAHLILTKCLQWTKGFDPGSSFARINCYVNLGECFLRRGLTTQSLNAFSSALGLILQKQGSPRLAEVYLNLSRLTNKIGDHDGSLDFAKKALQQSLLDNKNEQISKQESIFLSETPFDKEDSEEQWTSSTEVNMIICYQNLAKNEEKFLHFDEAKKLLAAALESTQKYFGESHKRTQKLLQKIQAFDIRHSAFVQNNQKSQIKTQQSESAAKRVTTQSASPYRLKLYIDNPAKQTQPLQTNGKEKRVLSISKTKPTAKYLTQNGLTTESQISRPLSSSRAAISARSTSLAEQQSVLDSHSYSKDTSRINKFYILSSHSIKSSNGMNPTKSIERSMNTLNQNPRIPSPRQARSKILVTARINKNSEGSDIVFSTNTTQNLNKTKEIEDIQRANSPEQRAASLKINESQKARGQTEFKQNKWIWTTLNTEEADIQQKKQVIVSQNPVNQPQKIDYLQGRKHYLENMNRIQKEKCAYPFQLSSTNEQVTLKRSAEFVKKINEQVFLKVKEQTNQNLSNVHNQRGQQQQKVIFNQSPQYQKANLTAKPSKQFIPRCLGTDFINSELLSEGKIVEQEQIQGNYLLYEDKKYQINTLNPNQNDYRSHAQEQPSIQQCYGNLKFYLHSNKMSILIQFEIISPQTTGNKQLQHLMNISDLHSFSNLQLDNILVSMCKKVQAFLFIDCCLTVLYIQIKTQPFDEDKSIYGFPKIIEFPKEGISIYLVKKDLANSIIYCQNIEVSPTQNGRQMGTIFNQYQKQIQDVNYGESNTNTNNYDMENNNLSDTLQLNESEEERENYLNDSIKNSYFELFDLLDFSENCKSPESEQYQQTKNSQQKLLVCPPFSFGSRQVNNY